MSKEIARTTALLAIAVSPRRATSSAMTEAKGRATILVVDDDADVLDLTGEVLEEAGYEVIRASGPEPALEVLRGTRAVHLLLTDIVMPGLNGLALADEARRLRPDLRVLYTSAFVKTAPFGDGTQGGPSFGTLVNKPWRLDRLCWAVDEALE
jgi:CheY-like chemotaxis protein